MKNVTENMCLLQRRKILSWETIWWHNLIIYIRIDKMILCISIRSSNMQMKNVTLNSVQMLFSYFHTSTESYENDKKQNCIRTPIKCNIVSNSTNFDSHFISALIWKSGCFCAWRKRWKIKCYKQSYAIDATRIERSRQTCDFGMVDGIYLCNNKYSSSNAQSRHSDLLLFFLKI